MILRSLLLQNYKQYENEKIEFREGLIGIVGKNGAGKSSIFEAVLLALFGEIPFTKEYLRRQGAGESAAVLVSLEIEVDAKSYSIRREFRGKYLNPQAELFGGDETLLAKGQKEVTAFVVKLIGMGRDAFTRSIFSSQKELDALSANLRGGERREFIRKLIGVSKIDEIQKLIRNDINRLKSESDGQRKLLYNAEEIAKINEAIVQAQAQHETLSAELVAKEKEYTTISHKYDDAKKKYLGRQELFKKYSEIEKKLTTTATRLENKQNQRALNTKKLEEAAALSEEREQLQPLEAKYAGLKTELEALGAQQDRFYKKQALADQQKSLNEEVKKLHEELASLEQENDQSRGFLKSNSALEDEIKKRKHEYDKKTDALNTLIGRLVSLRDLVEEQKNNFEKIKAQGPHSVCPLCLRPLEDLFEETLGQITGKIADYSRESTALAEDEAIKKAKLNAFKNDISLLEEKAHKIKIQTVILEQQALRYGKIQAEAKEKQKKLQGLAAKLAELGDVQYKESVYTKKKNDFDALEKSHERLTAIAERSKEIPGLEAEAKSLANEIQRLAEEKTKNETALAGVGYSEKSYDAALKNMNEQEENKEKLNTELTALRKKNSDSAFSVANLKKELSNDTERRGGIEEQEKSLVTMKTLDKYMDDFKTAILERIRPAIGLYASRLFETLTQGRYNAISIDEDFGFLILDGDEYYPLDRFSGGERDLANLCLRLALSKAVQDLEGARQINFLAFDEIFGSQDRERRYEILAALYKLQEQYRQILIISHIDEMKDEFPEILEVRRTPEGSRATWV